VKNNFDKVKCIKSDIYEGEYYNENDLEEYYNENDLEEDHCIKVKKMKIWKKVSFYNLKGVLMYCRSY